VLFVFDLDGTLIDSRRDLTDASNDLLAAHGAAPLDEASVAAMVGEGAATLVRRVLAAVPGLERIDDLVAVMARKDGPGRSAYLIVEVEVEPPVQEAPVPPRANVGS